MFRLTLKVRFQFCRVTISYCAQTDSPIMLPIQKLVRSSPHCPPAESSRLLINLANCRGGSDNSTVIVVGIDSYPPTIDEGPIDLSAAAALDTTQDMPIRSLSNLPQILLAATAVLCLVAGITLGVMTRFLPAAFLIAASVLSWLISRRMVNRIELASKDDFSTTDSPPNTATTPPLDQSVSRPQVPATPFHPNSPYRIISAAVSDTYLAEVQSDLVQAARDGAWEVDFEEVTNLNKQAVFSQQSGKPTQTIKSRAKAIDMLMRELYRRSRST